MTGFDAQPTTLSPLSEPDRPSAASTARLLAGSAAVGALLSVLVGWLWVALSNPPSVPLARGGGIYLGEEALNRDSGVTLWYFVLGLGFGALAGLVIGWFAQRYGWVAVVAVLLLCVVGAVVTRYLGVHAFGADPRDEASHAHVGDAIQIGVSVDTWVAYLGWPIGGLVGALAAIAGWSRSSNPPHLPGKSPTLG